MGLPDMKLPIQYALSYPDRFKTDFPRLSFMEHTELTFQQPDLKIFRNLALAFEAMKLGGNMPCILNASNEVLVSLFLKDKIGFLQMPEIIENCMSKADFIKKPSYDDLAESDKMARKLTLDLVKSI
jgi:1-deoxy-D-xylulose-5-phosphate reductoisomerase